MPVNDLSQLRALIETKQAIQLILECDTADDLQAAKTEFQNTKAAVKQLMAGTRKAANKFKNHIDNQHRAASRAVKKDAKDQERKDLAEAKGMAKEAADRVNTPTVKPIFNEWDAIAKLPGITPIKPFSGDGVLQIDGPCCKPRTTKFMLGGCRARSSSSCRPSAG
eukprot:640111-Heterocapsa_arctica.AAC.1